VSVTVVSCIYGQGYDRFLSGWDESVRRLDPRPDDVIVTSDRHHDLKCAQVFVVPVMTWRHPQAFYLQKAVRAALTDWVWVVDIDDEPLPDGLAGLDEVAADVWQMGYERTDGHVHVPPALTAAEYLEGAGNPYTAGSAFRTAVFREVGGFRDVAFQDWDLWRRMAASGASFEPSSRANYRYRLHDRSRTATELTAESRPAHVAEMERLAYA